MGSSGYLVDTNICIYQFDGRLPAFAEDLLKKNRAVISVITQIELLAWKKATVAELQIIKDFVSRAAIFQLTPAVVEATIDIRRNYRTKLPDAVIAATALINDFTLVSRNERDFSMIEGLNVYNPFSEELG